MSVLKLAFIAAMLATPVTSTMPPPTQVAAPDKSVLEWNNLFKTTRDHYMSGEFQAALKFAEQTLTVALRTFGSQDPRIGRSYNNLAANQYELGLYAQAFDNYTKAIAVYKLNPSESRESLGLAYSNQAEAARFLSREVDAEKALNNAIEILEPIETRLVLAALPSAHNNLGRLLQQLGRLDEAETHFSKSLEINRQQFGEDSIETATDYLALGSLHFDAGDNHNAETMMKRALSLTERHFGTKHADVGDILEQLNDLYVAEGRNKEALDSIDRALTIKSAVFGKDSTQLTDGMQRKADTLELMEDYAGAEAQLRKAESILLKAYGRESGIYARTEQFLGIFLYRRDRFSEAEPYLVHATNTLERTLPYLTEMRGHSLIALSEIYAADGRQAESESALDKAIALIDVGSPPLAPAAQRPAELDKR